MKQKLISHITKSPVTQQINISKKTSLAGVNTLILYKRGKISCEAVKVLTPHKPGRISRAAARHHNKGGRINHEGKN